MEEKQKKLKNDERLVSIRGLTVHAGGQVLLKDMELDIFDKDLLGVVGESGSGKTMLIRSLLNILPNECEWEATRFEMFGTNCIGLPANKWRQLVGANFGFVPQNTVYYLHPSIKIRKQIADGFVAYGKGTYEQGIERAKELLSKIGFDDPDRILNSYAWELSGGMRQRVNIAMALMNSPRILIADEPTTALDAAIRRQIMDLFREIAEKTGVAELIISHDLAMLRGYTRRLLVMYAGRPAELGQTEELFNTPVHPYTKALISVIPRLGRDPEERLPEIPGFVPDSGREHPGCIFRDRCPHAVAACEQKVEVINMGGGHLCRCILAGGNNNV